MQERKTPLHLKHVVKKRDEKIYPTQPNGHNTPLFDI